MLTALNMSSSQSPDDERKQTLRKELLQLNTQRDNTEKEIKQWQSILQSQNVGMDDSLVDEQGFPRNDIDVYQVRTARNKIICLSNDARGLMRQIEEKLFLFHDLEKHDNTDDNPEK